MIEDYIIIRELEAENERLQSERDEALKYKTRWDHMIANKLSFHEEFDRVEIKDQQGNLKGYGKDHISAIDDAMEKEQ